ncbi:MAG: tetratricopeptide repeat protein [Nitrospinae bacterium]|nr:tetratricopeptide repeat protein [Nitrospinota bacterium]MZH42238.1 tetratricopeptide repeat protein [Nitrospinota bacterium]MZH45825.1 tetratricopeptide repeat protein [Nitrospinota bacterium]
MKTWVLVLVIAFGISGCSKSLSEPPLNLLPGAEPSAKSRNDLGIKHYKAGRYQDALLHFNQANFADPTSGEIYFNLGLTYLQKGKKEKAVKSFRKARKLAKGSPKILQSAILNELLLDSQEG